MTPDSGVRSVA